MNLTVGMMAVYPAYGLAQITKIEKRKILDKDMSFYILRVLDSGIKVMVPVNKTASLLRPVIEYAQCNNILQILSSPGSINYTSWNRRLKNISQKINTEDVEKTAEALRDLYLLQMHKDLSFGEKLLLEKAIKMLSDELSLAMNIEKDHATELINKSLYKSYANLSHEHSNHNIKDFQELKVGNYS